METRGKSQVIEGCTEFDDMINWHPLEQPEVAVPSLLENKKTLLSERDIKIFDREFHCEQQGISFLSNSEGRAMAHRHRQEFPIVETKKLASGNLSTMTVASSKNFNSENLAMAKAKLYVLNRTKCLKGNIRRFKGKQFSDPFKLFQEISWERPYWLLPLHRQEKILDTGFNLGIPAHLAGGRALVQHGSVYTLKPIYDNASDLTLWMKAKGYSYKHFNKAVLGQEEEDFSGLRLASTSGMDTLTLQLFKRAKARSQKLLGLPHAEMYSEFRGSRFSCSPSGTTSTSVEMSNPNVFHFRKKSKRGGRRIPVSLPSPYMNSSGLPNSPHSLAACIDSLSEGERQFCVKTKLDPRVYQNAKETMIRNSISEGLFKKTAAQKMFRMDVNKTGKIYDFIVLKGWMERPE